MLLGNHPCRARQVLERQRRQSSATASTKSERSITSLGSTSRTSSAAPTAGVTKERYPTPSLRARHIRTRPSTDGSTSASARASKSGTELVRPGLARRLYAWTNDIQVHRSPSRRAPRAASDRDTPASTSTPFHSESAPMYATTMVFAERAPGLEPVQVNPGTGFDDPLPGYPEIKELLPNQFALHADEVCSRNLALEDGELMPTDERCASSGAADAPRHSCPGAAQGDVWPDAESCRAVSWDASRHDVCEAAVRSRVTGDSGSVKAGGVKRETGGPRGCPRSAAMARGNRDGEKVTSRPGRTNPSAMSLAAAPRPPWPGSAGAATTTRMPTPCSRWPSSSITLTSCQAL